MIKILENIIYGTIISGDKIKFISIKFILYIKHQFV